jgi:hypothetical protein
VGSPVHALPAGEVGLTARVMIFPLAERE